MTGFVDADVVVELARRVAAGELTVDEAQTTVGLLAVDVEGDEWQLGGDGHLERLVVDGNGADGG